MIRSAFAALLLLLPAAIQEEKKPKGLEGVGLKQDDITRAVNRAVDWLHESSLGPVQNDADYPAALAILHAGGLKRQKDFQEKIEQLISGTDVQTLGTYQLGVLAMICEALKDPKWIPTLIRVVQRLLDLQGEDGAWGYGRMETPEPPKKEETPSDESKPSRIQITGGKPLDNSVRKGMAMSRKLKWGPGEEHRDPSATQYALLGLLCGHRAGLAIDPEAWKRAKKYFLEGQSEDGGWGYSPGDAGYGSMTCAGVSSIAFASFVLGEKDWQEQPAIKKGLGWLAKNFTVEVNPPARDDWHYYYLYGLERTSRALGREFIGGQEWYPIGAKYLLSKQQDAGNWNSGKDDNEVLSTAFAIFFLTRATPELKIPEPKTGKGTLVTVVNSPKAPEKTPEKPKEGGGVGGGRQVYYFIMDCSGSMGERMGGKKKFEIVQDVVCATIRELPKGSWVGLRAYGHRYPDTNALSDRDSELIVPVGPLDVEAVTKRVRKLDYNGKTPMAYSLREAAKDLRDVKVEKITVILLTDGGETGIGANPAKDAAALIKSVPNSILNVVAFDMGTDPEGKKQCDAMAAAGRGQCLPAKDAAELLKHLKTAAAPPKADPITPAGTETKIAYELLDKDGKKLVDGVFGDRHELEPGKYRFKCVVEKEPIEEELWINAGVVTTVTADLSGSFKDWNASGTIGSTKFRLTKLKASFIPAGDEDGALEFEGHLRGRVATRAKRLEELKEATLELPEGMEYGIVGEEPFVWKSGTLEIESAGNGEIKGRLTGTIKYRGKELKADLTLYAPLK